MGKNLEILINPDSRLRKKSTVLEAKDIEAGKYTQLGLDMCETMLSSDGIGLAAPQISQNIRLITINTKDGALIMFNPKIVKKSLFKNWDEEGCLSVPYYFGEVRRYQSITCQFIDEKGKPKKMRASGLMARVMQHEIDHLDGILFIDKAKNLKKIDEGDIEEMGERKK